MKSFIVALAFFLLVCIVSVIVFIRVMFGTYSIKEAYHIFNTIRSLEKKYSALFDQRDNLVYHIGWAKSRGDFDEARQMMKNLDAMDDDLDELEREINMWKGRGTNTKKNEC